MSQAQWNEPTYELYEPGETPRELRRQGETAAGQPPTTPECAVRAHPGPRGLAHGLPLGPFLVPSTICVLIYLMTDAGGYFWPMWVMLGTGLPLLLTLIGRITRD